MRLCMSVACVVRGVHALQNAVPQWTRTRTWTTALLAFGLPFGDRIHDGHD